VLTKTEAMLTVHDFHDAHFLTMQCRIAVKCSGNPQLEGAGNNRSLVREKPRANMVSSNCSETLAY